MKRVLLSALCLSLSLVACKSSSKPELKIGFILDNMNEERYAKDRQYFTDEVTRLNGEVLFDSANSDVATQLSKVENMLASGVKALVIQPVDSNASSTMAKMAKEAGVPVVAYDRIINGAPIDLYVTQDSFNVGVLQAKAAVEATGGKGNFIILSGQQGHSVAESITAGVLSVLKTYPAIKVVAHQYHAGWSTQLALTTVENALAKNHNKIDAVLANNSGMAHGAVQAVAEQKLSDKVFIAGADADLAAVKDIVSGKQDFEVLKDIKPLAVTAAQSAVALALGKEVASDATMENQSGALIKVANTPVYPITKDDIETRILESGFHSRSDVYGKN